MPTAEMAELRAEALVRSYCGWHIAPSVTETITLRSAYGARVLMLPSLKVTAVSTVTYVGEAGTLAVEADFTTGVLRMSSAAWSGGLVTVTFTHGYSDMPFEVQAVLEGLTERMTDTPGMVTQVGAVRYATGGDGLPVGGILTASDKTVLDAYRLPRLA